RKLARFFVLIVVAIAIVHLRAVGVQKSADADRIAQALKDLGADNYEAREKASQLLWVAGKAAEPGLRQALRSDDAEVVARARELLDKISAGITPGTPRQFAELATRARAGGPDMWPGLVIELLELGAEGFDFARNVAEGQPSDDLKAQYRHGLDLEC